MSPISFISRPQEVICMLESIINDPNTDDERRNRLSEIRDTLIRYAGSIRNLDQLHPSSHSYKIQNRLLKRALNRLEKYN